jgi:predicted metalloendopeptidase
LLLQSFLWLRAIKRRINFRSYQKKHGYACNPGDNFDAYVNGTWVKTIKFQLIKLPTVLLMSCMINLKRCKRLSKKHQRYFTEGSDEQKIGDYYSSFMNRKDRDAKGIAPIQPELKILMLLQIIQIWHILENQTEQVFQCFFLCRYRRF